MARLSKSIPREIMKNAQRKAPSNEIQTCRPETFELQWLIAFDMLILHEIYETQSLVGNHLDTIHDLTVDVQRGAFTALISGNYT